MYGVDLIITITDRSRAEVFADWFHSQEIPLVLTVFGQGTATEEILDCLGLEETEKAVQFCLAPRSGRRVRRAARELLLDVPGSGILMTVPVDSIGTTTAKECLPTAQEEDEMKEKSAYELVVVITNQGCTDQVMEAARAAGAGGGTTIHARGTGAALAKKFFGVSIAEEREIVFILVPSAVKTPVMKAVMSRAGLQSEARSLVFALPVNDIAGLGTPETEP